MDLGFIDTVSLLCWVIDVREGGGGGGGEEEGGEEEEDNDDDERNPPLFLSCFLWHYGIWYMLYHSATVKILPVVLSYSHPHGPFLVCLPVYFCVCIF